MSTTYAYKPGEVFAVVKRSERDRYYWSVYEQVSPRVADCLAVAPISDHRRTEAEAWEDLAKIINCELPRAIPLPEGCTPPRAPAPATTIHHSPFTILRLSALSLLVGIVLGFLLSALTGCDHLRPGSPKVDPAAAPAAIATAADRIDTSADTIDQAAQLSPPQVPVILTQTAAIRRETGTIRPAAVALADYSSEQQAAANAAQAETEKLKDAPRRTWNWLMRIGMILGAATLLGAGVVMFVFHQPKFAGSLALLGLGTLAGSYFLAAYLGYLMAAVAVLAVLAALTMAWHARHNLFLDPPERSIYPMPPPATPESLQ